MPKNVAIAATLAVPTISSSAVGLRTLMNGRLMRYDAKGAGHARLMARTAARVRPSSSKTANARSSSSSFCSLVSGGLVRSTCCRSTRSVGSTLSPTRMQPGCTISVPTAKRYLRCCLMAALKPGDTEPSRSRQGMMHRRHCNTPASRTESPTQTCAPCTRCTSSQNGSMSSPSTTTLGRKRRRASFTPVSSSTRRREARVHTVGPSNLGSSLHRPRRSFSPGFSSTRLNQASAARCCRSSPKSNVTCSPCAALRVTVDGGVNASSRTEYNSWQVRPAT